MEKSERRKREKSDKDNGSRRRAPLVRHGGERCETCAVDQSHWRSVKMFPVHRQATNRPRCAPPSWTFFFCASNEMVDFKDKTRKRTMVKGLLVRGDERNDEMRQRQRVATRMRARDRGRLSREHDWTNGEMARRPGCILRRAGRVCLSVLTFLTVPSAPGPSESHLRHSTTTTLCYIYDDDRQSVRWDCSTFC